jgi:phage terminase large subunit-like protein
MQSLIIAITTAGVDTSGICYEQRSYLVKILQGIQQDETYFGVIYTVDPEDIDNWDDPAVWAKANPLLGVSVSIADMKRKAAKARSMPSARAAFLRYHLNIWGEGEQQWMSPQRWNQRAVPLAIEQLRGRRAVIGLDLASKVDVAAAVIVSRDAAGHYLVVPRFWVPEKRLGENDSYYGWHQEGWLLTTPGETIDFEAIEDEIKDLCAELDVWAVPYDRFQAVQFATRMTAEKVPMAEFAQVVSKMSEPMKAVEALVIEGKVSHDGNPMMAWMMSNVQVLVDRKDNVYPRKARPENKIDGPVALIMAMAMWLGEEVPKVSKYKQGADLTVLGVA